MNRTAIGYFLNITTQICAIFVVILHQYNVSCLPRTSSLVISFISHGICTAAVPMFFFISGYLFWHNASNIDAINKKIFRRVKSIFFPFVIWNCIYAILLITINKTWSEINIQEVISSLFLYKYYFPMWYMFQLMVYFTLSYIIYVVDKLWKYNIGIIICSLAIVSVFCTNKISFEYDGIDRVAIHFNYLVYFLLGMQVSKSRVELGELPLPKLFTLLIVFLIISFISALCYDGYIDSCYNRILVPLVFCSFLFTMVKVSQLLESDCVDFSQSPQLLGGASPISIYFIHGFVGILLINIFEYIGWNNSLMRYLALCLLSVIGSILIATSLKRLVPSIYRILCGNRI